MTKDLTASMQRAIAHNREWVSAEVSGALEQRIEAVCQSEKLRILRRWTQDEPWAFLADAANRPVACIWRRAPFAFVTADAPSELQAFLGAWQAQLIEVDDWYTSTFSLDLEAMKPFHPWFTWQAEPEAVSPLKMTLLDVVWATE